MKKMELTLKHIEEFVSYHFDIGSFGGAKSVEVTDFYDFTDAFHSHLNIGVSINWLT